MTSAYKEMLLELVYPTDEPASMKSFHSTLGGFDSRYENYD